MSLGPRRHFFSSRPKFERQSRSLEGVMRVTVVRILAAGVLWFASASGAGAQTATYPYDHIHLNVPDPAAACNWYEKNFGGKRITEGPNRLMFGSTRFMFLQNATGKPSAGSAIDHVGFSFPDLDAKMKEFEAAGVKITTPARDVPGLFKLAFVEDPWGTRIEVVQDPELLGLHHVHMRGPDPEQVMSWLLDKFGGKRQQLKGRIDAVRYDAEGFSSMWILVQKGEAEPSIGHAIDHIGWRSTKPLNDTIAELKAKGVEVTAEPRPLNLPNGPSINFSYVAGPAGARIEIVERPGLKPGQ
jgi:catechol 2,3-dioxygenase-like lactoylglutathione lyase family enzyme